MKLLLVLAVVCFAVWLWRRGRTLPPNNAAPPSTPAPDVAPMVPCLHCQLHMPLNEAVRGQLGFYCSAAHRQAAGDHAPTA